MLRSIRWRLTLSFAGIALLAALALGAVLLAVIQNYYSRLELDYLQSNAKSISLMLAKITASELNRDAIQPQVENFAFLSQTRVRVLDENGHELYDSGTPQRFNVAVGVARQRITFENTPGEKPTTEITRIISIGDMVTKTIRTTDNSADGTLPAKDQIFFLYKSMPAVGTPFGFDLGAEVSMTVVRSSQAVRVPLLDSTGKTQGYVELSQGPALGKEIASSVARGTAIAGAIAVLLAAGAGWFISKRLTAPLLELTRATSRMASGDLSSRADLRHQDEFGRLAQSFNEMANQVQATIATLRGFVSDAAHELHTPLTALHANLDLAEESADGRVFFERARAMVKRMETLTSDLLDLSRLEANGTHHALEPVNLTELVEQSSEVYASQAEQAGLALELDLPPTPLYIQGGTIQVRRVLDNLVENACKFTPPGGSVSLSLKKDRNLVHLSVSDTGIGIPAEDLPQLFNRFHRGRNAAAYAGSGLGLAIVKAILEQQNGHVSAENTSHGARFTVEWPYLA